jgi:putative ABC transport system permease protein
VKKFGWKDPIGKQFEGEPVKTVIGVAKDFNFFSLHAPIGPLIMSIDPGSFRYLLVKIKPQNISSTLDFVKNKWQDLFPGVTFDYSFLDQYFDDVYKSDRRTGNIFGFFSGFAIFIACLGLFGLAAFTAEQRTKEMGVRKVLGASVGGIILLLCKDFIKLVLVSCLVAVPLSYLVMDNWLSDFAYRVGIEWWIFVLSGVAALAIALITVSFQAIKAANANPIESLRYE